MQTHLRTAALILLGVFFGFGIATAQYSALDPVRVAPHIFENVFENDQLRVLKVTERNGETPPLHSHPERLLVYLSPCAWMDEMADGSVQMQSFRLGDIGWAAPLTHGGVTSNVVQDCSRLEIELKPSSGVPDLR